jgi:Exopolyphosphatase
MTIHYMKRVLLTVCLPLISFGFLYSQSTFKLKYKNSSVYAGIDVGSKGVKLSVLEIGNNAKKNGAFNVLKDTAINTDFISFTEPAFQSTLNGLYKLYSIAVKDYNISPERVFILVSSGIKVQAEKAEKTNWVKNLVDSFKLRSKEPTRQIPMIDVKEEARLSHLGIVPDLRRYSTFLIDIGSGNTKGGYFPYGNTKDFKLFQLTWGTKSIANATEKRLEDDNSIINYNKQLQRVIAGEANSEIIYAINVSGAYNMSDNIAFSGGIAWSVATLMYPELLDNSVVSVTYDDVVKFGERLFREFPSFSETEIVKSIRDKSLDKAAIAKEVKRVHQVFDQRSLMSGTALLLKIMRQFEGIYAKKQFYLVKSGQVGWISAYVDQTIGK